MWIFYLLALIGLLASAMAHLSTFFGVDPMQVFPEVWLLHIGIFVVGIPAVVLQTYIPRQDGGKRNSFALAPNWMKRLTKFLGVYMLINFVIFICVKPDGQPFKQNGQYVITHHGKIVRQLTEQEYRQDQAITVRGFSGHWMFFYAAIMTILASAMAARQTEPPRAISTNVQSAHRGLMPIWLHRTMVLSAKMVGFMIGPITIIVLSTYKKLGAGSTVLFIVSPFCGFLLAGSLTKRMLSAKCPACAGRAFCESETPLRYRCLDCGHIESLRRR